MLFLSTFSRKVCLKSRFLENNCKCVLESKRDHYEGFPRWWSSSLRCDNTRNDLYLLIAANDEVCRGLPDNLLHCSHAKHTREDLDEL